MNYAIIKSGESRSFPDADAFYDNATNEAQAETVIYSGTPFKPDATKALILIELGDESLAEHTGEEGFSNVLGFARYRNGDDAPSMLIELVKQASHSEQTILAAREFFQSHGFQVVVSTDQIGRIINRLVLPKYNAALRFLDEGLASQQDMDLTCKLGLGYPDGPIERVVRGGLHHHYARTKALFDTYGSPSYAPPRRAVVASRRIPFSEKTRK
ncbi:3-hydroxybutyryl-CoA dehydrogenase [Nitrobacteraceae bacterium AZCC 1564]